ncbi:MAG TPA: hypothetical protein VFV65_01605 [Gemmatimonadales bacterium]|nr:hypothetical protein [Gemmatimonadales bacterium]
MRAFDPARIASGAGVNTQGNETFPAVTPDGCSLVFVRDFSSVHLVTLAAAAPAP